MTEDPDVHGGSPEPAPDLEYDLAHEAATPASGGTAQGERPAPDAMTYVATETTDYDGDYGYDLAHDVPGR